MNRMKILVYSFVGLLVVGFAFFLFSLGYTSLETMSAQSVQERLAKEVKLELEWRTIHDDWDDVKNTFATFKKKYLIESEQFNTFKQQLQSLAMKNRLGGVKIDYNIHSQYSDVVKISFKLNVTGAYENLKRFIFDIESREEMIFFKRIELSKDKVAMNRVKGILALEAYFVR